MKASSSVFLAILALLFPVILAAQDVITEVAMAKRGAALKLSTAVPGTRVFINALGVFISNDGLALVNLSSIALRQKPAAFTVDGTELPLGTILGIFPEQELALVKYNYRPKVWTPLAPKEPENRDRRAHFRKILGRKDPAGRRSGDGEADHPRWESSRGEVPKSDEPWFRHVS
jgi:hypothetical protein